MTISGLCHRDGASQLFHAAPSLIALGQKFFSLKEFLKNADQILDCKVLSTCFKLIYVQLYPFTAVSQPKQPNESVKKWWALLKQCKLLPPMPQEIGNQYEIEHFLIVNVFVDRNSINIDSKYVKGNFIDCSIDFTQQIADALQKVCN